MPSSTASRSAGPSGLELPEALVQAIRRSVEGLEREGDSLEGDRAVRERVPASQRGRFDELLAEARRTYRLRDERSIYSSDWAMGLMRRGSWPPGSGRRQRADRATGAPGRRDLRRDPLHGPRREGPSAAEFRGAVALPGHAHGHRGATGAGRSAASPPPPLEQLPAATRAGDARVITAVGLVFTNSLRRRARPVAVRSLPASPGVYEGTARVLHGREAQPASPGRGARHPSDLGGVQRGPAAARGPGHRSRGPARPRGDRLPGVRDPPRGRDADATSIIADGARVRVDGATGEVRVLGDRQRHWAVALAEAYIEGELGRKPCSSGAAIRAGLAGAGGGAAGGAGRGGPASDPAAVTEFSGVRDPSPARWPSAPQRRPGCAVQLRRPAPDPAQRRIARHSSSRPPAVWHSGRSASALAYRRKLGIEGDPRMGIVAASPRPRGRGRAFYPPPRDRRRRARDRGDLGARRGSSTGPGDARPLPAGPTGDVFERSPGRKQSPSALSLTARRLLLSRAAGDLVQALCLDDRRLTSLSRPGPPVRGGVPGTGGTSSGRSRIRICTSSSAGRSPSP